VSGESRPNIFEGTRLRFPYLGAATGVQGATMYQDAAFSPVIIERMLSPVIERISQTMYFQVTQHREDYPVGPAWCMRRVVHMGVTRTLMELTPGHDQVALLEFSAMVAPVALTLASSQRPVDLPYDDEVAGAIVSIAGDSLVRHSQFDAERAGDTRTAAADGWRQLSTIPQELNAGPHEMGTPYGF
jgi:hypothetical protein